MNRYPADVEDFPFPFDRDSYHYSANVQAAGRGERTEAGEWGRTIFRIGPEYRALVAQRGSVLEREPDRSARLPHMVPAEWDALIWTMTTLAEESPEHFALTGDGVDFLWVNRVLDISQPFRFGDTASLPHPPLEYIARQVTEDLILLDQRESQLWADAGVLTFSSVWSLAFDVGMSFRDIHGPVPGAGAGGVFDRAQQFLMRLAPGEVYRRLNWGIQTAAAVDLAMESFQEWMPSRIAFARRDATAAEEEVGELLHVRVEVQHLIRLPRTGAIMFTIGIRLLPISRLLMVPGWAERTIAVFRTLPSDIRDYKGIAGLDDRVIEFLEKRLVAAAPQEIS